MMTIVTDGGVCDDDGDRWYDGGCDDDSEG